MHHDHPELLKDQYWDEIVTELPHTVASMNNREEPPVPSTDRVEVSANKAEIVNVMPSSIKIDEMVGKSYEFPENKETEESDKVRYIHKIFFNENSDFAWIRDLIWLTELFNFGDGSKKSLACTNSIISMLQTIDLQIFKTFFIIYIGDMGLFHMNTLQLTSNLS